MSETERNRGDPWGRRTRWTVIKTASDEVPSPEAVEAWEDLVDRYREPVRRQIGRMLKHHPSANDIADDFFGYLYSQKLLARAEPKLGRFRCFIQGVLKRYVKQSYRDSGKATIPVEDSGVASEPDVLELEEREEAEWAGAVLDHAVRKLIDESPRDGELLLRAFGIPPYPAISRKQLGKEMNMQKSALNVAIHRARDRLRRLIISEIRDIVGSDEDLRLETTVIEKRLLESKPGLFDLIVEDDRDRDFTDWKEEPD